MDIAAWLRSLGLERYWVVLPKLTADDLKDIGVTAVGHRRMLLEAIAALGASVATQTGRRQSRMYRLPPRRNGAS